MRAGGERVVNFEGTCNANIGMPRICTFDTEAQADEVRARYAD